MEDKEREEVLQKLLQEHNIEEMVKFSDYDIQDKLQQNAFQIVKYRELYLKEKNDLDKLNALKEKIVGEQYDFYRFHFDKELKPQEITTYYFPKDEKILKINSLIRKQQWRVDFFDICVDALGKMAWNMKAFLESYKVGL